MKMTRLTRILCGAFLLILIIPFPGSGSGHGDSLNKKRTTALLVGLPVLHGSSIVLFNELWYQNQPRENFHFFDDGKEWNQVDKAGHLYSGFHFNAIASRLYQWCGFNDMKSDLYGSATSFAFMSTIEILDGYSSEFGASGWDVLANAGGIGLYLGQKLVWDEIRIHPKFSFSPTGFADTRPQVLGGNFMEQLFKDYNGQTYWLSFDLNKFFENKFRFPKWLNIATGYGSTNMIYARKSENYNAGYNSYRQYYLSLDIDLSHVHTRSAFLNSILYFINMIHLPSPGLEFNKNGVKVRYLTF
jgi:hypothetical protein